MLPDYDENNGPDDQDEDLSKGMMLDIELQFDMKSRQRERAFD